MGFGLSAEDIAGIKEEQDSRNELATPTKEQNPTFEAQGGEEPQFGVWSERVKIRDTKLGPPKKDPTSTTKHVFQISLEVLGSAEGGVDKPNGGRKFNHVEYIDTADLAKEDRAWAVRRKLGVINSILVACGADITNGIDDYENFFGKDKPLIGAVATTTWSKRKYISKGKEGKSFDCVGYFPIATE